MRPLPLFFLLLFSAGLVAAETRPLRIGVELDSPPMSFVDAKGRRTGFTIELLQEMAKVGDFEVELVPDYWSKLLPRLDTGEIDVLGNIVITEARRSAMDFSIGHARVHGVTYRRDDQPPLRLTRDFAGKRIGVLAGSIAYVNAMVHQGWGAEIIPYTSWQDSLDATHRGELDATLLLSPVSSRLANTHNLHIELVDDITHQYRMAVRKGEAERLAQLNESLALLRHNGTFDRLFAKWIGPIEPRPLRFTDIRPYLLPVLTGLAILSLIIWWQRHTLHRTARQAEALRVSEERWKFAIESSGDGLWDWDAITGRVLRSNQWMQMLGYNQADIGDTLDGWRHLIHPDDLPPVLEAQEAHHQGLTPAFSIEHRLRCKDGSWKWVLNRGKVVKRDADGRPLRVIGTHTDLTARKQAEEDRLVLSKLESTGILAGGIAHDFNNLLAVIVLNLDLAQLVGDSREAVEKRLLEAKKAALAARHLTQQLITFARGGSTVRQATSLEQLIHESVQLALSGASIGSEVVVAPDLRPVEVDEGQIGQVIRNLVINAREAMSGKGTIRLRAENITLARTDNPSLPAGDYVCVCISDTGPGIPAKVLPKIFDPYFSTKDRGVQKGMGLGLTICHSVIQQHQGAITVESSPAGTTFRVYLPSLRQPAAPAPAETRASLPGTRPGRILLMDDEASIRETVGGTLQGLGYTVQTAGEGREALALYAAVQSSGGFDLVILDLTVRGGLGGVDTLQALKAINPAVTAIVMSGYANATELRDFAQHGFKAALTKPFPLETLRATLAQFIR